MIIDAVFSYMMNVLYWIFTPFPDADYAFAGTLSTRITDFKALFAHLEAFVPVNTAFTLLGYVVIVEASWYSFYFLVWILKKSHLLG